MFKKLFSSELRKGTIILFITINLFNFLNFLFHFSMGRMLGPEDYGTLAVLMSLLYIYSIPSEAIQTLISKYTSKFNLKKENGKIKGLIGRSLHRGIFVASIAFLFLSIVGLFLASFLKINFWLIFTTNLLIFFLILVPILRGILQGRKEFSKLGLSMVSESFVKVILAIFFVYLGFEVFGAITGVLLGTLVGFVISLKMNKKVLKEKLEKIHLKKPYEEGIPYFIAMLAIFVFFSLDIILAKRFFPGEIAGQYAVLSMLGKMIFAGTLAISKAMFPLTSEKGDSKESSRIFGKSFLTILSMCSIIIFIYWIAPEVIINILYGGVYVLIAPQLVYSGIAFSVLSLTNVLLIYNLSKNKMKGCSFLFVFVLTEIILLSIFNSNIKEYVLALMFSNIIMFIGSLFLFNFNKNGKN